jgi:hypothetical protein
VQVCDPISLLLPDMQLNDDRIYLLPDGREVIARKTEGMGYQLFDPRLGPAAAPIYFVCEEGKLSFWGRPVPWVVADLTDTGRTARRAVQHLELIRIA